MNRGRGAPRGSRWSRAALGRQHRSLASEPDRDGFTLIELLVVIVVLPLVVGAISVALISVFKLQTGVGARVSGAGDALAVSSNFDRDVQSAALLTTSATPACGTTGAQVLGLSWSSAQTVVSYVELAEGATNSLFRRVCKAGGTTPVSTTAVSHDVAASQVATITCATTAVSCAASTAWIGTAGVSSVVLSITESLSGYSYSLTAVPRTWSAVSGGVSAGGQAVLPFLLLGTGTCSNPVLSIIGSSVVTVGSGTGTLGLSSACASSIVVNNSGSLSAGAIVTADSSLTSYSGGGGPTETYQSGGPANPFASLVAPTNPTTSLTGSCTGTTAVTCTPGTYQSLPSLSGGATLTFGAGTYIFVGAVSIANDNNVVFGSGTYWFEGGLSLGGGISASFGTGTYLLGTSGSTGTAVNIANGVSISSGAAGVLFYGEGGSFIFAGGATTNLTALTQYKGVTIWDAGASGTTNPLSLSNASSVSTNIGGIYAPTGEVLLSGGGSMTSNFVVASTASFSNATNLTIG